MTSNSDSKKNTPLWRFWVPFLFQTALIIAVPTQAVYTVLTGKTVILQTAPVDPYELLRGYSQTLRYNISSQENLRQLKGWEELPKQKITQPDGQDVSLIEPGTILYVVLQAPEKADSAELPLAWQPIFLRAKLPSQLSANQIFLKGIAQGGFVQYGLETYYMPEDQREQINTELGKAGQVEPNSSPQTPPIVMEIKVNKQGEAVPVSIWAQLREGDQERILNYRF
ncbi:GDYXXLXY domain-containing protein [Lyngbya aestuarii]|uniref:GDYXXLXY domain-containing protein n=1 Tax=Lyngbya aestuarii TaxID=118322 RepID=UPI00403DA3FB